MKYSLSFSIGICLPILLWILFTPFSGWLDLTISRMFYDQGAFHANFFWDWLFIYGVWPAWILAALAAIGLLFSLSPAFQNWRRPCLYLLITFAIGSGLIIHAGFKDHWGRPRPRQVIDFGGKQPFRPYYQPNFNQPEPSKSFTCGHCSLGFTFFSVAILGAYYRSRLVFWLGWLLAWGLGILLSAARIVQGGHFVSDTLASALIMWLTAWGLAHLLIFNGPKRDERFNT